MQNTKSTILENWAGPTETEAPRRSTYCFAIKQDSINLDFYLKSFFTKDKVEFHYFNNFEELITICHRFEIDTIFIDSGNDINQDLKLVRAIKENVFIYIIPVILYHPDPDTNSIISAYENGVDDFIYGEWVNHLVEVKIKKIIDRSRRDLSVNPSTRLPGTNIIEKEISRQIEMNAEFAICYADLDNFKAYNDYYGYTRGDKVVRLTAKIIRDIVFDSCREGFVGHIAGDDYIFIIPPDRVDDICSSVIRVFDLLIPFRYELEDRKRGSISSVNRRGEKEEFPLLTISIAVIINQSGSFEHVGELSKMLADLKKATKMKSGSNYMVERRKKY